MNEALEHYSLEADANYVGEVWIMVWHDPCGKFLVEDYARRINFTLMELVRLAGEHEMECDRES